MTTTTTPTRCPPPRGRTAALIGVTALTSLFLAACGGDSDTPASPPAAADQVPASAAANSASLEAFALAQPQSETASPLLLDNVPTFPTSETESPIVLP